MPRNNWGGRPGLRRRRENALERAKKRFAQFVSEHKDLAPRWSHGGTRYHEGRPWEVECARQEKYIKALMSKPAL